MRRIKECWAHATLVLVGAAAVGVLLARSFQPCESFEPAEGAPIFSPAGHPQCQSADQARASVRELGLQSIPLLLKKVRHRQADLEKTIAALRTLGPAAVPGLAAGFDDRSEAVRLVATRTIVRRGCTTPG